MDEAVRKISVTTKSGPYTVSVGSGILDSLSKGIPALANNARKLFVLTSPKIRPCGAGACKLRLLPGNRSFCFCPRESVTSE